MTQPGVSHLARQTLHRTALPGLTAPVWSSSVKHTENDSVFLIVLCDSELLSYEKALRQELEQILSWMHIPAGEQKRPSESRKTHRPRETLPRRAVCFSVRGDQIKPSSEASC